jgi:hypothetical protein
VNAILFVQFKDSAVAGPLGFSTEYPYPVYHIDAVEAEDGGLCAQFLLANREGNFCWVDQADVKRVKGQTQGNGGKYSKGGPPRDGRNRGRFGDRKYSDGNSRRDQYPPQEQYVNPEAAPQES